MSPPSEIVWEAGLLVVRISIDEQGVPRMQEIRHKFQKAASSSNAYFKDASLPLFECRIEGEGSRSFKGSKSLIGTYGASRLTYQSHSIEETPSNSTLRITVQDATTGIAATMTLSVPHDIAAVRATVEVTNKSSEPVTLMQMSSLTVGNLAEGSIGWHQNYGLSFATNSWFREAQWHEHPLPRLGIDDTGLYALNQGHDAPLTQFSVSNHGMFSTEGHLPIGMLRKKDNTDTWIWQVENNGSWRWEIGEYRNSCYVSLIGPEARDHEWSKTLQPGESFNTVPVVLCRVPGGSDDAFTELTKYRRTMIRPHNDRTKLDIIFNDFMNCLMGLPTEAKVHALIRPAAEAGATYFCIDAGWYSDEDGWWDEVGEWKESNARFPSGLKHTIDAIRANGMVPGLWLEPEVVGVRSPVAKQLPDECYFLRNGKRVLEKQRYQLDFSVPRTREWMTSIVEGLISSFGVGYFKFDYNVDPSLGQDANGVSPGDGQLTHNRASLSWLRGLLDRHPNLIIENCSSGGQRLDYASLAVLPIQSTSDQQDPILYVAIAAAMPTAVLPEQGASWCYPQPDWSYEKLSFTVVNSLLGRVHLSGRIDLLDAKQLGFIAEGMAVHRSIRAELPLATAFWPLGLPQWSDDWIALGMKVPAAKHAYLSVWRRGGSDRCSLPIPHMSKTSGVEILFPTREVTLTGFMADLDRLLLKFPVSPSARFFKLTYE